jgi:hypothetical protein
MKNILFVLAGMLIAGAATAKLPALSDDAKIKATEAQAKTAHGAKVAAYQLCQSQDKVAGKFADKAKVVATTPCANPGPFVPDSAVVTASAGSVSAVPKPASAVSVPAAPKSASAVSVPASAAPTEKK